MNDNTKDPREAVLEVGAKGSGGVTVFADGFTAFLVNLDAADPIRQRLASSCLAAVIADAYDLQLDTSEVATGVRRFLVTGVNPFDEGRSRETTPEEEDDG